MPNFFPHKNRKISALLWIVVFLLLILLNIFGSFLFPFDRVRNLKLSVLQKPFESSPHEKLAQYYLVFNLEAAEKEFQLAQTKQVLGVFDYYSVREKMESEVAFWKKVVQLLPDYQYSYLKLTTLNFQLGDINSSQGNLTILLTRNPGNKKAMELSGIFNKD